MKDIYNLALHESVQLTKTTSVMRVAGGWIYISGIASAVFVPLNDEFLKNGD